MNLDFYKKLTDTIDKEYIYIDEPMKKHITFRVGGNADYFVTPKTVEDIKKVIALCKNEGIPYYILGNGSNLLVSDQGYRGVIIQIYKEMSDIKIEGNYVKAQAGALLSKIGSQAFEYGLTGFEFAAGIPGTLGGAVVMNAGAYGGEMKDIIEEVLVLTPEGKILKLKNEELELGYRTSIISKKNYIVLEAIIRLESGDKDVIKQRMDELRFQRTSKQPLEFPSAGSTFKRPEGYFAGALIEQAGLKGKGIGGAEVSEKHAGFVINKNMATAKDIYDTILFVIEKVKENSGVVLEPEVRMIGKF